MRNVYALLTLGRPLTSLLGALAIFAASLVGVGTLVFRYSPQVLLGAVLGFIFTMASNSMNDYFDQDNDKINHPERPIPSGKINAESALTFSIALFMVALLMAFFLSTFVGFEAFVLVLFALGLQVAYEKKIKRTKFLGNITIGFQTVLAFILGGVIVKAVIPAAMMASASFLAIIGREVVKDVEDIKGDIDRNSLPKLIGIKNANIVASILLVSAVIVSVIAYYPLSIFGLSYFITVLMADLLFLCSIPIIFRDSNMARRILKFAMLWALMAFIIGGIFT
jgi:geranylgeranylglycerol-phosphate geranylgeranyltransferase